MTRVPERESNDGAIIWLTGIKITELSVWVELYEKRELVA